MERTQQPKRSRDLLKARCTQLGVLLLDCGDSLSIDAPIGYTLPHGAHSRTLALRGWSREDAFASLLDDLQAPLIVCDDAECDACVHEPMTFEAIAELYRGKRIA